MAVALINERFPSNQAISDQAVKSLLEDFAEVAEFVGEVRFVQAVRSAIKVSHRRWDCSVARVREMAGLRWTPQPSPAAKAWQFVTDTYLNHVRTNPNGNYVFEEKVVVRDGKAKVTPVPEIPAAVDRALRAIGGWAAVAEAWPEYTAQRFGQFKEFFYEDDASLCVDSKKSLPSPQI